jgi:tripartite-type tricarboxylate transporter receptor subunit TctC
MNPKSPLARLLAAALLAFAASCTLAQEGYPSRTVRFIVPFPAATPPDFLARIAAQKLAEAWGSPVIVENRDGASGTIGVSAVVKAPPDGHTLLFAPDFPIAMAPATLKISYDPQKDLVPVAALAEGDYVLVVHPSLSAASVPELVALAKAKPGTLTFATSGRGAPSSMCVHLIKAVTGTDLTEVPYKGAAPAIQAVLSGDVSMYCSPVFQALPQIRAGKLRALGATGTRPSPFIPEVPTIVSQGFPDVVASAWYGVFAPADTPAPVLEKIRDSLKKIFDEPEVRKRLPAAGINPIWPEVATLRATIAADIEKWSAVAQKAGIKAD